MTPPSVLGVTAWICDPLLNTDKRLSQPDVSYISDAIGLEGRGHDSWEEFEEDWGDGKRTRLLVNERFILKTQTPKGHLPTPPAAHGPQVTGTLHS